MMTGMYNQLVFMYCWKSSIFTLYNRFSYFGCIVLQAAFQSSTEELKLYFLLFTYLAEFSFYTEVSLLM